MEDAYIVSILFYHRVLVRSLLRNRQPPEAGLRLRVTHQQPFDVLQFLPEWAASVEARLAAIRARDGAGRFYDFRKAALRV
jgi:hypothetical protein